MRITSIIRATALLGALAGGLLCSSGSASAFDIHNSSFSFGTEGTGPGQLSAFPEFVAVNEATHDLYVSDIENGRVDEFTPTGEFLLEIDGTSSGPFGSFEIGSIAIDNSTDSGDASAGDIYVANDAQKVIDKFSATGKYLGQLSGTPSRLFHSNFLFLAVSPTGNLWVGENEGPESGEEVYEFDDSLENRFLKQWGVGGGSGVLGIAADSENNVYVIHDEVKKFSSTGQLLNRNVGDLPEQVGPETPVQVAVEASTGDVYITTEHPSPSEAEKVLVFTGNGSPPLAQSSFSAENFAPAGRIGGIAVDSGNGSVYVVHVRAGFIDVFPGLALADAVGGPPSGLTPASVRLNGAVDPNGLAVSECLFEYGASTEYGHAVPCEANPGSGRASVSVAASITGLAVGKVYHYRLAVTNENGTNYTEDQVIATPPTIAGSESASGETSFAVTLTGIVKPGEVTPSYHFAYGTSTAYGSSVPLSDATTSAGGEQTVTQTLTGLQPGTTYHYALVATNFGGGVSVGPDETFTTRPLVPPVVSTGGAEAVGETAATLTGAVDPQGLHSTYQFEYGTTTSYGSSWPNVQTAAGSNSGSQAIAVGLENLQPATTYHYRLVAVNEDGTTYGPDQTFTTQSYPASVVAATPVGGPLGVTLSGAKSQGTTHHAKKAKKKRKKTMKGKARRKPRAKGKRKQKK